MASGRDERPNNARVILLDAEGRVAWFADHGYSARGMMDLDARARPAGKAFEAG